MNDHPLIRIPELVDRQPTREEIRDWVVLRKVIQSDAAIDDQDLTLVLWGLGAKCCLLPFEFEYGDFARWGWKERRVKDHIDEVKKRWLEAVGTDGPEVKRKPKSEQTGFEHLRQFQFVETVVPHQKLISQGDNGSGQLLLFSKDAHAPSHFRAAWHCLPPLIFPKSLFRDKRLPSGVRIPALFYVFDKDWDSGIITVDFELFGEVFRKDDRTRREFIERMTKKYKWWTQVESRPGRKLFKETRPVHEPHQERLLEAMLNFDEVANGFLRAFLPLFRFSNASTVTTIAIRNNPLACSAPEQSVTKCSAPDATEGHEAEQSVTKYSAPDATEGHEAEQLVTKYSAPDATEADQIRRTATQAAAIGQILQERMAKERQPTQSARDLQKDLKIPEKTKTFEPGFSGFHPGRALDLQDLSGAGEENPKTEDQAYKVLSQELRFFQALGKKAERICPWIIFDLACMANCIPIDWPYAPKLTFCESDLVKLNGIFERTKKQPIRPERNDPKQHCALNYFRGALKGLIAEMVADEDRAEAIKQSKDFFEGGYNQARATAERIGYDWIPNEMFPPFDPRKPVRRFDRLQSKGG